MISYAINLLCDNPGCSRYTMEDGLETPDLPAVFKSAHEEGWAIELIGGEVRLTCPECVTKGAA